MQRPLPGRRRRRRPATDRRTGPVSRQPLAAVVLAVLLATLVAGCRDSGIDGFPPALQGTWTTDNPRYEDRALVIQEHAVLFGIGDGQFMAHGVSSIDTTQGPDYTAYTVLYRSAPGYVFTFRFRYWDSPDSVIRFEHQQEITWHKDESGP